MIPFFSKGIHVHLLQILCLIYRHRVNSMYYRFKPSIKHVFVSDLFLPPPTPMFLPPPTPILWGVTTPLQNRVAMAASAAEPPFRRKSLKFHKNYISLKSVRKFVLVWTDFLSCCGRFCVREATVPADVWASDIVTDHRPAVDAHLVCRVIYLGDGALGSLLTATRLLGGQPDHHNVGYRHIQNQEPNELLGVANSRLFLRHSVMWFLCNGAVKESRV